MELDQLKSIWKESDAAVSNTSPEELEKMLQMQSKSPIAKMKRNLFWELIVIATIYIGTIFYYLFENKPGMLYLALMLFVIGVMYVWYYVKKRTLLKNIECVTCEVKSNLSSQLASLEKLIHLYLWLGTILIPVVLILSFIVGLIFTDNGHFIKELGDKLVYVILVWVVFSLICTVPMYFVNKWYVNLLYGRHVKKLRQILNEMNEMPVQTIKNNNL